MKGSSRGNLHRRRRRGAGLALKRFVRQSWTDVPCIDCAVVEKGSYRAFRSGSNDDIAPTLRSATRHVYHPHHRGNIGARCAR